ncbi:MAG: amino acid transporter substrate-binding protein family, partial [Nocardioides sp.]|nr:amino acid transporter substrate-binding protein family [Nocardioides sp.]
MRMRGSVVVPALLSTLALAACAPAEDTSSAPKSTTKTAAECAQDATYLKDGTLTIATDSPAYEPWFSNNNPVNGKGFESAVAYAVADRLGFDQGDVGWVKVPFNNSYLPGQKRFDFDINQISITPERARVVDFSDGYYAAAQAVVVLKKDGATPTSFADLKGLKLGAQTGTTSLTAIRDEIQPGEDPLVFHNNNVPKQALLNGQVDAIVMDLPTAFYITAVEIPGSTIVGQFQAAGQQEEFGMLFGKGSDLVP